MCSKWTPKSPFRSLVALWKSLSSLVRGSHEEIWKASGQKQADEAWLRFVEVEERMIANSDSLTGETSAVVLRVI